MAQCSNNNPMTLNVQKAKKRSTVLRESNKTNRLNGSDSKPKDKPIPSQIKRKSSKQRISKRLKSTSEQRLKELGLLDCSEESDLSAVESDNSPESDSESSDPSVLLEPRRKLPSLKMRFNNKKYESPISHPLSIRTRKEYLPAGIYSKYFKIQGKVERGDYKPFIFKLPFYYGMTILETKVDFDLPYDIMYEYEMGLLEVERKSSPYTTISTSTKEL